MLVISLFPTSVKMTPVVKIDISACISNKQWPTTICETSRLDGYIIIDNLHNSWWKSISNHLQVPQLILHISLGTLYFRVLLLLSSTISHNLTNRSVSRQMDSRWWWSAVDRCSWWCYFFSWRSLFRMLFGANLFPLPSLVLGQVQK